MSSVAPTPPNLPKTPYQGNSKVAAAKASEAEESKDEVTRIKKIEVNVVKVKKPLGKRIAESFGGQDLKGVGRFVALEVLLPGARDILFDVVKEGAHRALYGDSSRRQSSGSSISSGGSRLRPTNYSSISSQSRIVGSSARSDQPSMSSRERQMFDFSGLLIEDLGKAEEILMEMEAAIDEFGLVTVGDFYEAIGESGNGFTDRKFGWDAQAFEGATPKRVRGGWILDIPTPVGIK